MRKRLLLVSGLVLAVAAGAVVVVKRNADAPAAAVREYLDAIARGDAATANALVDPKVKRTLLSDEVLAAAERRIEVDEVVLDGEADPSVDTVVPVWVVYRVGADRTAATLRVTRAGSTAGVLDDWRVIDPLVAEVLLTSTVPLLATVRLGAAEVPVSASHHLYPGVYGVRGTGSRYLEAAPATVTVFGGASRVQDADVEVRVDYVPTGELRALVAERIDEYTAACVVGGSRGCPSGITAALAEGGTGLRVERPSSMRRIVVDDHECDERACELGVDTTTGQVAFTGPDGTPDSATFKVFATVTLAPDDEVTVMFY